MISISCLPLIVFFSSAFADPKARLYADDKWPFFPRGDNPRRPPPPWDVALRPVRPYPVRATEPTPEEETQKPVVLYKTNCDPCLPGWGLKTMCNEKSATVCTPCALGTWTPKVPHYRQCEPCSKCGDGLYEEFACTSTRDTACDACANAKSKRINEDFMRKCDWWRILGADNFDWDGRLDVEVVDLKERERAAMDESSDSDSDEDASDEIGLTLFNFQKDGQEKDITVDDPEIDSDLPKDKKEDAEDDVSRDEEEEWTRVVALRDKTIKETLDIDELVEKEGEKEDLVDEGDDVPVKRLYPDLPIMPHRVIRPYPQQMPASENVIHLEDDIVPAKDPSAENNFPPSYHSYSIDSLIHTGIDQRRKAIVLLILASAIVLSTVAFIVCYVREFLRRRSSYNRVVVVNLSPEDQDIIRQSAQKLESVQKPVKKYRLGGSGYSPIINAESQTSVYVTENPLEAYLNSASEDQVENEVLTDNEILEPVYRPTTTTK